MWICERVKSAPWRDVFLLPFTLHWWDQIWNTRHNSGYLFPEIKTDPEQGNKDERIWECCLGWQTEETCDQSGWMTQIM